MPYIHRGRRFEFVDEPTEYGNELANKYEKNLWKTYYGDLGKYKEEFKRWKRTELKEYNEELKEYKKILNYGIKRIIFIGFYFIIKNQKLHKNLFLQKNQQNLLVIQKIHLQK